MSTYYIATTGNDTTGNGSSGTPWLTLTKAMASSTVNDIIIMKNGTYAKENITCLNKTIQAQTNGSVIIDGANGNMAWATQGTVNITGIKFQNFIQSSLGLFNYSGSSTPTLTFTNCEFKLISLFSSAGSDGGGLITATSGVTGQVTINLNNCVLNDLITTAGPVNYSEIFVMGYGGTTPILNMNNCTILFKTASSLNVKHIFFSEQRVCTYNIKNTIIYNTSGATINWKADSDGGSTVNNSTYSDFYLITGSPTGTGVITTDPLFVDAANGNFNLRPTSPCIDTGTMV